MKGQEKEDRGRRKRAGEEGVGCVGSKSEE